MESLFFLEEQIQNGLVFRLGQPSGDRDFLRWEPMLVKLKGNEAVVFRESLARRRDIFSRPGTVAGILSYSGPASWEGKLWLGVEARLGKSAFEMDRTQVSLDQLIHGLFPIINSYVNCHGSGFSAGKPDWGRFFYDDQGFYLPDPLAAPCLPSPPCNPPAGFAACYPPEIYRGEKYGGASDLFFLGLILYYGITRAMPYPLRKGWPNEGILAGEVIPPLFHRPELNPTLSELIVNLLAVDPARRPSAQVVAEVWGEIIGAEEYTVSKREAVSQIKQSRRLWRRQTCGWKIRRFGSFFRSRLTLVVGVLVVVMVLFYSIRGLNTGPREASPLEFARNYYAKAAVMDGPVLGMMNEETPEGLMKDFELARRERMKIVSEVLSKPLARVDSMRMLETGTKKANVEVSLTWWRWDGAGWKASIGREVLVMEKVKEGWKVKERKSI